MGTALRTGFVTARGLAHTGGMKVYMVGGAVRDRLLGLPVQDRDWVVVLSLIHI